MMQQHLAAAAAAAAAPSVILQVQTFQQPRIPDPRWQKSVHACQTAAAAAAAAADNGAAAGDIGAAAADTGAAAAGNALASQQQTYSPLAALAPPHARPRSERRCHFHGAEAGSTWRFLPWQTPFETKLNC